MTILTAIASLVNLWANPSDSPHAPQVRKLEGLLWLLRHGNAELHLIPVLDISRRFPEAMPWQINSNG